MRCAYTFPIIKVFYGRGHLGLMLRAHGLTPVVPFRVEEPPLIRLVLALKMGV